MSKVHNVIVEKGKVTPSQFGFMSPAWAAVAVHCAQENMAALPDGTKMLCRVRMRDGFWSSDFKLVRDFNLVDKVRVFGLKDALLNRGSR